MSVSAFNPTYAATNAAPTANAPVANAPVANAPTANYATDAYAPSANVAPAANNAAPTANAPIEGLPSANAPVATIMPVDNGTVPSANQAPSVNVAPSANVAPTANAPVAVAPKSTGGFLGSLLAGLGGGLLALKGIVPKFFPTLLQNASKLKIGGIFGIGALAGSLIFGLVKSKFSAPSPAQGVQSAQSFPPEAIAQVQGYLQQGVSPQQLAQAGVPVEALRQAGAQV